MTSGLSKQTSYSVFSDMCSWTTDGIEDIRRGGKGTFRVMNQVDGMWCFCWIDDHIDNSGILAGALYFPAKPDSFGEQ